MSVGPLAGKRVLLTRAEGQATEATALLEERGASAVLVPAIAIGPPEDPESAARAVARIAEYDWVAFTSANGVERAVDILRRSGRDARALGAARLAAVGPATASALARFGLSAEVVAEELRGEGLARVILGATRAPGRLLLLRAGEAREALPDALRAAGFLVDVAAVYATRPAPDLEARLRAITPPVGPGVDAVVFSSSSTVRHVVAALGAAAPALLRAPAIVSLGPLTTETATSLGLRVDVEASPSTLPSAIRALEAWLGAQRG